jgi:adenosine deaminase
VTQLSSATSISPALLSRIQAMPKAEIHVHLEGATTAETIYELAQRNQVKLPVSSAAEWQAFYQFRNFNHFVEVYIQALQCMRSPEDYALMVERFIQQQAQQNIRYSEVYISDAPHIRQIPDDELVDAIATAAEAGAAKYHSQVKFIADISREHPDTQTRILEFALAGKKRGIFIGISIGGIEVGFPPELFIETYVEARKQGLRVVAHAGEADGATSIWGAIDHLQVERIGHGIRCLDDPDLVEVLRQRQIPLEVSPQSNYRLGFVQADQFHPIRQMFDAGLYCTLNSDDPAMFSTSLNQEYLTLAAQGFSWQELWQLNLNTLEATFLSESEKARYRQEWQSFYHNHL